MKRTTIKCPKCKGRGAVELSEPLEAVFNFANQCVEVTASGCQKHFDDDIGATAFNNRLERLFNVGMLKRKRDGRQWIYFTKTK